MMHEMGEGKMVSMKMEAKPEKTTPMSAAMGDQPMYPYGLEVRLDTDALKKLGLADHLPKVGAGMMLHAKVDVTSVSENDTKGGKSCNVTLQITDLGLEPAKKTKTAEETLYQKG